MCTSYILRKRLSIIILPGVTIIFRVFLSLFPPKDPLLLLRMDRFRHHRRRCRRHRDSFSRSDSVSSGTRCAEASVPLVVATALDFVSNKSRGLRNLAYDLALMQTVSLALPFSSVFLFLSHHRLPPSSPLARSSFSLLSRLSRRPDAPSIFHQSAGKER